MRNFISYRLPYLFVLLALAYGCSAASEEEAVEDDQDVDAPSVPAPGTMAIDLTVSSDVEPLTDDSDQFRLSMKSAGLNYALGMLIIKSVDLYVAANLVIPVKFLREARALSPKLLSANTYVWSFDFEYDGVVWTGDMTGIRSQSDEATIAWTMNITRDPLHANGCCEDFTAFTGETTGDGVGEWQIYDPADADSTSKLFSIAYDIEDEDNANLLFEINSSRPSNENFGEGSSILYRSTSEQVILTVKNSAQELEPTIVEWDKSTLEGSLTVGEDDPKCWTSKDDGHNNEAC